MPDTGTPQSILILDDDEVMRDLLDALLSPEGYTVTLAGSGPEGAALLASGLAPALVLTDLQMPGSEGPDLARLLRPLMPEGSVLLGMSGSQPDEATRSAFDGFLLKPFDAQAVQAAAQAARRSRPVWGTDSSESAATTDLSTTESAPVLDDAIFASLRKIIPAEKLAELYELTVADILKRYQRMQVAAAEGDLLTVKREAHATKGSCGMVGAQELQRLAAAIEEGTSLNTAELSEIPEACDRLRRMLLGKLK